MAMGVREPSANQKRADNLKDQGNLYFKKEKLGAAIEAYTEAITLCPSVPVYWTNRALCERKRNEWEKVENDCRRALELDSRSFKAYYMLGLALLQYQQYEEAVTQLEKALDLSRGAMHSNYMVEEIWQELAKAKLLEWEAVVDLRTQRQLDLKSHLTRLLREDYEKQLKETIEGIKANGGSEGKTPEEESPNLSKAVEVDDLIRFDSGSKAESLGKDKSLTASKADTHANTMPISSEGELERLYRTYSEPGKFDNSALNEVDQGNGQEVFDPLKQHKLSITHSRSRSRSRSSSIRRQSSQPVSSILDNMANGPASFRKSNPTPTRQNSRKNMRAGTRPSNDTVVPATNLAVSTSKITGGDNEATDIRSIYDVYKVVKELMKLRQNEAGQKLLKISEVYQRRSQVMEDVFQKVAAPDIIDDVPDHLCCKITMDVFRDPVITPSGITYERSAITDHIRKNGKFDPFTRAHLTEDQIFPNIALKEAVQIYLNDHGWAYGSS